MADEASVASWFGLSPDDPNFHEAITHPSYANECHDRVHYQRLEFLGDSVLGLCASEALFLRFPDADEGRLTRLRARLVNADALAEWAREHRLYDVIRLGRGAESGRLSSSTNVLCDVVEALIGATYLRGGMDAARHVCRSIIEPVIEGFEPNAGMDPKSVLQETVQKLGRALPLYDVVERGGPDHDPWYLVRVSVNGIALGEGRGRSKRLAERAAARKALATEARELRAAVLQSKAEDG